MELAAFFPMWDQLSETQRQTLTQIAVRRQAQAGAVLHRGSDDCLGLLLVESGQLRASLLSPEGREITIYRLFPRDICLLSASCMMRSIQFDITIEAEKDTQFLLVPPDRFQALMTQSAPLANYTNEIMASRFSEVMWLIEQILWKSLDKRLAGFLLEEAALEDTPSLKITHEHIANHLGSAREVVTRMLRYFQSENLVHLTRGTVEIVDSGRLSQIAQE